MAVTAKLSEDIKKQSGAILSGDVKSYANEPYFIEKANKAREVIKRVGFPTKK